MHRRYTPEKLESVRERARSAGLTDEEADFEASIHHVGRWGIASKLEASGRAPEDFVRLYNSVQDKYVSRDPEHLELREDGIHRVRVSDGGEEDVLAVTSAEIAEITGAAGAKR